MSRVSSSMKRAPFPFRFPFTSWFRKKSLSLNATGSSRSSMVSQPMIYSLFFRRSRIRGTMFIPPGYSTAGRYSAGTAVSAAAVTGTGADSGVGSGVGFTAGGTAVSGGGAGAMAGSVAAGSVAAAISRSSREVLRDETQSAPYPRSRNAP